MRKLYHYLRDYIQNYFNWKLYLITTLFIALYIGFNYSINFENGVIDYIRNKPLRVLAFSFTEAFAFWFVCLLIMFFTKNKTIFSSKEFWMKSLLGFLILGTYRVFNFREIATAYTKIQKPFDFSERY